MKKTHLKLLIGCICMVFLFIVLPTLPAYFKIFDFSSTGNIGDTIGGLSSPIIGIIGSYLVYISFQEQLRANQMQVDALNQERKRYEAGRWYQKKLDNFSELKHSINNLKFTLPIGTNPEWDYYDEVLEFGGVNALRLIKEKLSNYNNLTSVQKYAIDLYVYEFGQKVTNFSVLVKAVSSNKEYFPEEYIELSENIDEIYYAYLLLPLEELAARLNSGNDRKNVRTMLYKTNRELENIIDPDGLKRDNQKGL